MVSVWEYQTVRMRHSTGPLLVSSTILPQIQINSPILFGISGSKNVLSIFVSNPRYAGTLKVIKLFQDGKHVRTIPLRKIHDDQYVTDPVSFDERSFKVGFLGKDPVGQNFERIVSTVLNSEKGMNYHWFICANSIKSKL
jgi:hypothetical protein